MIKVLHIITGLGAGGAQNCLLQLIKHNHNKDIINGVISLGRGNLYNQEVSKITDYFKVIPINKNFSSIINFLKINQEINNFNPDIVQSWLYHADLLTTLSIFLSRRKTKLIWNIRCSDMMGRYDKGINKLLLKTLSGLSFKPDVIISNSQAGIDEHIKKGYKNDRMVKVSNGINTNTFKLTHSKRKQIRDVLGIPNNILLAGNIGRYDIVKGHKIIIKALSKSKDIWCLFVGEGITKAVEIQKLIKQYNLKNRVILLEQRNDIHEILSSLDIYISSSFSEGFPTAVAEAMSCQVPIISTKAGDSFEIVKECGLFFKTGSSDDLFEKINRIKSMNLDEKEILVQAARKRIIDDFSIEKMVDKYHIIYRKLFNIS